ncbi:MAG: (2Fe-2S)-binding protein [Ideonella sp.]|nr:(2Fe-2S)-binding protein [Ideonella sp.]
MSHGNVNGRTISITVNNEHRELAAPARRLLCDLLRDDLHLTGTKRGCETGTCGACTVLVDGRAVKSCLTLAAQAAGRRVDTVEGLASGDTLHPLQQCFMQHGGLQCGYCTPGLLMTARALLADNPRPNEAQVREGINGNLCRCTGYGGVVDAILAAAEQMHGT